MPDTKVTDEAAAAALDGSELWRIVQAAASRKMTVAQLRTYLDTLYPPAIGIIVGRFYGIGMAYEVSSGTGATTTANQLRVAPWELKKTATFDQILTEVTTLVGASNFRLGVWADNGNRYPGALLVDSGVMSGAATGVITAAISPSKVLTPQMLWFGENADAAIGFRTAVIIGGNADIMGEPGTFGGTIRQMFYTLNSTFGPLPDPFPGGATVNTSSALIAKILMRAA